MYSGGSRVEAEAQWIERFQQSIALSPFVVGAVHRPSDGLNSHAGQWFRRERQRLSADHFEPGPAGRGAVEQVQSRRVASSSRLISPGAIDGAGMFADSGVAMPSLLGMGTPEQVGAAVVRAIERNRGEVTVAPLRQQVMGQFAANAPEAASRLSGGMATKIADQVAAGQTDKR
jgi:hypothetical protein